MRSYVRAGVVAGLSVGALYALYAAALVVPLVERAAAHEAGGGHPHDAGVVAGIDPATLVGVLAWTVTLGVVVAVAFYFLEPLLDGVERTSRGLLVGLAAFAALRVVPWRVYRPVSPAADLALPAEVYLPWYWGLVAASGAALLSAPFLHRRLRGSGGRRRARLGLVALAALPLAAAAVAPANPVESFGLGAAFGRRYLLTVVVGQFGLLAGLGLVVGRFAGVRLPEESVADPAESVGR